MFIISFVYMIGIAGKGDYTDAIYEQMIVKAEPYDPVKHAPELEHQASFTIDPAPYYANKKEVRPPVDKDGDVSLYISVPHPANVITMTSLPLSYV